MSPGPRPDWQLPTGVSRGLSDYIDSDHIADDYDEFFALTSLFEFDEAVLARHFTPPGLVVDLGCGTGRALIPLVRKGFRGLGVDLSTAMLRIVQEKADIDSLQVDLVQANLVELDAIANSVADYAICLFSTLGMISGRENRARAIAHMFRILKPGGRAVLHVHNVWNNLFDPLGRRFLFKHLPAAMLRRSVEFGDKVMPYRGIPNMYLHSFTRGELSGELRKAGFGIVELIPLSPTRQHELSHRWFLPRLRANGWVVVVERPRT